MLSLFDILSNDERVIVYSDKADRLIYTWNQSLTLQVWKCMENPNPYSPSLIKGDMWEELNVRTLPNAPLDYHEARKAAINWSTDVEYDACKNYDMI